MTERKRLRQAYRRARLERIRAGMADAFDLHDDEDVVCPHCGAYTKGSMSLPSVKIYPHGHKHFEMQCPDCDGSFGVRAEVHFRFTTFKPEPVIDL